MTLNIAKYQNQDKLDCDLLDQVKYIESVKEDAYSVIVTVREGSSLYPSDFRDWEARRGVYLFSVHGRVFTFWKTITFEEDKELTESVQQSLTYEGWDILTVRKISETFVVRLRPHLAITPKKIARLEKILDSKLSSICDDMMIFRK